MFGNYIYGALSPDYNETMYVFVMRGLFRMPHQPEYQPLVHDIYLERLEELSDATGPARRHTLWTLQRVVGALVERGDLIPSARVTELLAANPVPDAEGGWVTTDGQLYQNHDDPRTGAVPGTEIW